MKKYRLKWFATMTGLFALLAVPVLMVGNVTYAADTNGGAHYAGVSQCKVCHNKPSTGAQYTKWTQMKHAKAYETLKTDKAKAIAEKRGIKVAPNEAPECLKCHVTGYDVKTKSAPDNIKIEDGIQCETCHGPASNHIKDGKTLMFQPNKAGSIDLLAHLQLPTADTCKQCHNPESPTWNPEQFTTKDGKKVGFDFDQAKKIIAHPDPKLDAQKKK